MKNMIGIFQKRYGYFGNYPSWEQAKAKCRGYNDEIIVDSVVKKVAK